MGAFRLFSVVFGLVAGVNSADDHYTEYMFAKPLPEARAHVFFNLTVDTPHFGEGDNKPRGGLRLFPALFAQLASRVGLRRLRFSLSRGRWRSGEWGEQAIPTPSAAALFADFAQGGQGGTLPSGWSPLVQSLSGLLCASLDFLSPEAEPGYAHGVLMTGGEWDVWGFLPAEEQVCSENLSPLLGLLPARGDAGLAGVLNAPQQLFASRYHTLGVEFTRGDSGAVLSVVAEAVLDHPPASFSLATALAAPPTESVACPLCSSAPTAEVKEGGGRVVMLGAGGGRLGEVSWTANKTEAVAAVAAGVQLTPSCHDWGDVSGTLAVSAKVVRRGGTLRLVVPFPGDILEPRLHSFALRRGGEEGWATLSAPREGVTLKVLEGRSGYLLLEAVVEGLREGEEVLTRVEYDKRLLPLEQYPPDANKLYLFPSPVAWLNASQHPYYAPGFLAGTRLPYPDFSMPFNVVTLACTIVALFHGAILNFSVRDEIGEEDTTNE
eukprot:Hpha_TRINITY_DN34646_c0_g1::TRINITY_DN34646_c0_g1_i1::g.21109::m.21109/K05292/PIGT; phosphatidylinositol glycan, class T